MNIVTTSKPVPKSIMALFTGLIFGIAWASRGSFGHEQGAAWAGAMGVLALLAITKREDWLQKAPVLMALGAIGWAVGGMMSYGIVLSYAKGNDFGNVMYGLSSIALLGGLYGFIGGGLFALGLETTTNKKPNWAALITEMFIGGFLFWALLIYQLEWFMTPPRSELWAATLGAAVALGWHLHREGYSRSLRVALFTALGAGFGFSFGNYILTTGGALGLPYNWWNVMEFLIGFCGGSAMTYAIISQDWPNSLPASNGKNWTALVFVVLIIPLINFSEAFSTQQFVKLASRLPIENVADFVMLNRWIGILIIMVVTGLAFYVWNKFKDNSTLLTYSIIPYAAFLYSLYYIVFNWLKNGIFHLGFPISDSVTLYLPILGVAVAIWLSYRNKTVLFSNNNKISISIKKWLIYTTLLFVILVVLSFVIINTVGVENATKRF